MGSKSRPDDLKPQLPLNLGVRSNGEFLQIPDARDRLVEQLVLERADANARHTGMDRRAFLASWAGMATTLAVIHLVSGCGDGSSDIAAVQCDQEGARALLDPHERFPFIMDVQTHHVDNSDAWREPGFPPWQETNQLYHTFFNFAFTGSCPERQQRVPCLGLDDYINLVFGQSDTSVAVLSTFPALTCEQSLRLGYDIGLGICGDFLPTAAIAHTRDTVNERAGSTRCVSHAAVIPNAPSWLSSADKDWWLDQQMQAMETAVRDHGIRAWKCYTPFGALPLELVNGKSFNQILGPVLTNQLTGNGWFLDDEPGIAFIEKARQLGATIINAHKGIPLPSFDTVHTSARDIGVVARRYPDVTFVVYHSAINFGGSGITSVIREGPYDPQAWTDLDDPPGINSLIHSCQVNGITAENNRNVVAELGGPGARAISDPIEGTHIFGKLLKYIGEDNIVWGTDAIWGGSPQGLLEGFVNFRMNAAIAEQHGYPELTDAHKAKILGLNAARIYGVDVGESRCEVAADPFAVLRADVRSARRTAPSPIHPLQLSQGPRSRRELLRLWASRNWLPV